MSTVTKTSIRRAAIRYRDWLLNQQWFNLKIKDKQAWLKPIEDIINKVANDPKSLWSSVIDHWHETSWDLDGRPEIFEHLYELVDEYRIYHGVDNV